MPSALTEGLFMMIPEQEAILGTPDGQLRYARGIVQGIESFLREMAH
jgi:N-acetylmuramoyl-L-alanine amidase